jgi:hypothetical protein
MLKQAFGDNSLGQTQTYDSYKHFKMAKHQLMMMMMMMIFGMAVYWHHKKKMWCSNSARS